MDQPYYYYRNANDFSFQRFYADWIGFHQKSPMVFGIVQEALLMLARSTSGSIERFTLATRLVTAPTATGTRPVRSVMEGGKQ